MARAYVGGKEVADCYLGGSKTAGGFIGSSPTCVKPHRFQMRVTAPSTPIYDTFGAGVLTTVDHGNGSYTIWSDGPISELVSHSKNEVTVVIDSALDLDSVSEVSLGGKGGWQECLNLESFDTTGMTSVYDCSMAWYGCPKLVHFDATGLTAVEYMDYAFYYCRRLESVTGEGLRSGLVLSFKNCWQGCSKLKCISAINTRRTQYKGDMFTGCTALVAPDPIYQAELEKSAGYTYINPNPCP